jgi:hypothetical protein
MGARTILYRTVTGGGSVDHRLRHVALPLLGAVLFGTVGLSLGAWYGGRGVTPPSYEQARSVAAELLPDKEPSDSSKVMNGSRFDVELAADDLGSGRVNFWYDDDPADCALAEQVRRNAANHGWQDLRPETDEWCDIWQAERDGLTLTLTHTLAGSRLAVAPAIPNKLIAITITITILGAGAGAALFRLVARQRPPVPLIIGTLVTAGLLPGVTFTWVILAGSPLTEPVWPVWPALAPLLVPLWLVLLPMGVYVLSPAGKRIDHHSGPPDPSAEADTETPRPPHNSTRVAVVVAVTCALTPVVMLAALFLLFMRAQPDRAATEAWLLSPPTTHLAISNRGDKLRHHARGQRYRLC